MARHHNILTSAVFLCVLLALQTSNAADKWSRQLEATGPGNADSFDWVPLAQPVDDSTKDRSGNGRVLTYSQSFPPDGHFANLQKPQSAQPFDFPYQFQRFLSAPQTQPLRQPTALKPSNVGLQSQEPTSQSFFKFEMPLINENVRPAGGPPTLQTGYQIQHGFGGNSQSSVFNSPLYNQAPVFPPEFHPIPQKPLQQPLQQKPLHQQNFIEDTLPLKNVFRDQKPLNPQQALQTVSPQVFPVDPQPEQLFEINKPTSFQPQLPFGQTADAPTASAAPGSAPNTTPLGTTGPQQQSPQDVQLLYVPYDTLYNQQQGNQAPPAQNPSFDINKYNANPALPEVNPYQINQFYTPDPVAPPAPTYYSTSTTTRPLTTTLNPNIFHNFASELTTAKPKPKAHQPPLAMFLVRTSARMTQSDVVGMLRNAQTIAVIDAPSKETPAIFVGPAGMPIPDGYVKFDLPYLSQLSQKRDLRDVPFFVAPLSYRTPNGFNKILLPEPHVGSIVINRSKDNAPPTQQPPPQLQQQQPQQLPQQNQVFITPLQNEFNQYQTSTQRHRPSHRVKQPSANKDYYQPEIQREKQRVPYDNVPHRGTSAPNRGNKFNYFYDQDAIQEVSSPKIHKQERPKKKRPQTVQIEQPSFTPSNPFDQFKPQTNQITTDDYFKVPVQKPTTTSTTSTSTTTTTTSTTSAPQTYFAYNTSPQVELHSTSTSGQLYPNFNNNNNAPQESQAPVAENYVPRFTTRPPPATNADEEYRMKQYFRQQDAFRNRPQLPNPTNSPFEQVEYTPVNFDYDREVKIPVTTQKTTTRQRVTFYSPTATPATVTAQEHFNAIASQADKGVPSNHRPAFNQNEIPDTPVEYEPNPYQLPSELPPLTPNLPGLVNDLQEKDKQNAIEQNPTTTPLAPEEEKTTRPTLRRPINRVRKPIVSKVTSSVSYSESESTSKRPAHRIRRPYGSRGSASSTASNSTDDESNTPSSTTRRPSSARNPLIRNPNRIRYQPTTEERQTLRIKQRKHYGSGSKKGNADEDLEYQRDVLKQNYPVFKPNTVRKPSSPTALPSTYAATTTTEGGTSETQQVYTVTPSNSIDNSEQQFPAGLLEPMQIAQQYSDFAQGNYGPGYFPNQEDLNPTEPIRNEINPVYTTVSSTTPLTTSSTTTSEEPEVTTRRSPFIRRPYPRLRTTTTETPTSTTEAPEEKASIRPRIPPRKVIKVRTRTRRPYHSASTTTSPEDEAPEQESSKQNYRKLNRFNQDLYENDVAKRRQRPQFHLEGQESQWSPAIKTINSHHFKPLNPKEKHIKEDTKVEEEPEIVTADPNAEQKPETYEFKVGANFGSATTDTKTTIKEPNLKPEKSFAELLEEVMGKAPEELPLESEETSPRTDGTYFESQKTTIGNRLNRRGKWKKLRTPTGSGAANNESFETAESQNLGTQLLNSLYAKSPEKSTNEADKESKGTTQMLSASASNSESQQLLTTTSAPQTTMDGYEMSSTAQPELTTVASTESMDIAATTSAATTLEQDSVAATRRIDEEDDMASADDLETQPSLFSEVKKQLHELFAVEDDDNGETMGKRRQDYTSIQRTKPETTTAASIDEIVAATSTTETAAESAPKNDFHKDLMERVVYATSTSTKVTSETEICYRGRCIRSEDLPPNHKLN